MRELSKMQQKIYEYIAACIREQGYPPSVREIGEAVGLKLSLIHILCEKCKVIRRKGRVMVICENPKHKQRQG